jgi:TolA-binding protein
VFTSPDVAEGNFAEAQRRMEWNNPKDPGDTSIGATLFQRGYLAMEAKEDRRALELFAELVRRFPRNPYADDALYFTGYIRQHRLKEYDEAAKIYTRLAKVYENRETAAQAMFANAQVAVAQNDADNVEPRLRKSQDLSVRNRSARGQKDNPSYVEEQSSQQLRIIDDNGPSPATIWLQGDQFMRSGQLEEAENSFKALVREHADTKLADDAAFALAECRRRAGKLDEAMRLYSAFLDKYPDSEHAPRARFMLAELKRFAGMDAEALELYARVAKQLEEMSRRVEHIGKRGPRVVKVKLSPELERLRQVTAARLTEMAAEQRPVTE